MPDTVRIWGLPSHAGLEFVQVGNLLDPIPPQISFAHKLVYFEQGAKRFYYRRQRLTAEAGQLMLIPPGEVHSAEAPSDSHVSLRVLSLPGALLRETSDESGSRPLSTPRDLSPFVTNTNARVETGALLRLAQSGAALMSWASVGMEMQRDVSVPPGPDLMKLIGSSFSADKNPFGLGT